uniref:Uncharacterized protein n=1 Tax=Stomoxys calcitrans TaxID=35570 RepID=A0A1I8Q9K0_STOCA
MVRLGRLLKTRLKEPFILDAATGKCVVVEDLPTEITAPSPSMESSISGSSSNTSTSTTVDSISTRLAADPTKVVINPTGSNGMACTAITGKLTDIAEVAESLDTVIRDIQENSQRVEVESNPSPRDKKLGTLRSTSSEDWHSRSTEDDSFVTASEGRTSSYMSCNKSSFDYSEGDDSTLAFDMPDVNSPFNMSFDESEHSFISAQQDGNKTPTKLSENDDVTLDELRAPSSLADIEDLHSESVTPTPAETEELYVDSIPVESETELEVATIANASSMQVLTECPKMPMSLTPEVSPCSNKRHTAQDEASTSNAQTNATNPNGSDQAKPSVAWRRSKYYENLTKQTIKGFLNKTPTKLSENDDVTLDELRAPSSLADIEDLHSESVTPTPAETEELYVDSIPVESETELEVATIANASSMQVLTECPKMPMSLTPEVSPCSNKRHTAQDEASTSNAQTNATNPNGSDQAKPSVAWRRSKYYENLTKQTIKGFL